MMISIRRILFPTDFSEPAREAQQYAVALAERFGAELHLLHIVAPVMPYPDASSPWVMPEKEVKLQIAAADQRLSVELDPKWTSQHNAKHATVTGFAVDEILKYAEANQIDLIVLGTHGHTGLSRFLIGSVTEKVVRLAKCPVLTVHPHAHQFLIETTEMRPTTAS